MPTKPLRFNPVRPFAAASRRPVLRRRGFTLVELLTVIGIIGLLGALAAIGFKVVGGTSRGKVTGIALENAKGLVDAFKLTNQVESLIDPVTIGYVTSKPSVAMARWQPAANLLAADWSVSNCRACSPDSVPSDGSYQASVTQREVSKRLLRDETARVIRRLMSVKENRTSVEAMGPDRIEKLKYLADSSSMTVPSGVPAEYPPATAGLVDGVNLLDGERNPIYFIPGGGLMWVNVGYKGTGDKADKANYDRQVLVRAIDRGPFWASPGPDGDLSTGDDNVYSSPVDNQQ